MDIGVDVDGVLANFQEGIIQKAKRENLKFYDHWTQWREWAPKYKEEFDRLFEMTEDDWQFWLGLELYDHASQVRWGERRGWLPFEPEMYVSARPKAPKGATKEWLLRNNFPEAEVHIVESGEDKLKHIRGLDIYIDDKISTILHIQENWTKENDLPVPVIFTMPWNDNAASDDASGVFYRINHFTDLKRVDSFKELYTG